MGDSPISLSFPHLTIFNQDYEGFPLFSLSFTHLTIFNVDYMGDSPISLPFPHLTIFNVDYEGYSIPLSLSFPNLIIA